MLLTSFPSLPRKKWRIEDHWEAMWDPRQHGLRVMGTGGGHNRTHSEDPNLIHGILLGHYPTHINSSYFVSLSPYFNTRSNYVHQILILCNYTLRGIFNSSPFWKFNPYEKMLWLKKIERVNQGEQNKMQARSCF